MSVRKPNIYKGMYCGNLNESLADTILRIRDTSVVPNLKNMIFDFGPELIMRSISSGISIRSIIKQEGIDYRNYIGELRDYQTVGLAFMYLSSRSIIGDGVGLGKTVEIAGLLNYLKMTKQLGRFLIAVDASALGQIQYELMRFTGLLVVALPSEANKLKSYLKKINWNNVDGIVIKHSCLKSDFFSRWLALNIREDNTCRIFDTFILDESSIIKNRNTKTFQYSENICNLARRVHFMNATTFETSIMDIYNQIDMMYNILLPSKSRIQNLYCNYSVSQYWKKVNGVAKQSFSYNLAGYKNQEDFKQKLRLVYFGRSKKDVGIDIPHVHLVYEVEPSLKQSLALSKGYRYMEVLNCPSLIPEIDIPTDIENVPKIERLINLIEHDFKDSRIMVYCFHTEAQRVIAEECIKLGRNPVILNGKTKEEEKYVIQSDFNSGKYDVIITNVKKSLNLHSADVCIFYSVDTNPSKMFQIAGRIDRNVNTDLKTYVLLIYNHTAEYSFFMDVVKNRAKDSRDLTIDTKTTVDYFLDYINGEDE